MVTSAVIVDALVRIAASGSVGGEFESFLAITEERSFGVFTELITSSVGRSALVHI